MALVEYLIAIAHAQRAMNHARTVTCDLSMMPHYRARIHTQFTDGVMMLEKKKVCRHDLNNIWVMPYNPYLLRLFNCRINVEACGSIKAVKYLFKYIYKGHDRASVAVREADKEDNEGNIDGIKQYRDARWVTPTEALWRIYGFDISDRSPSVLSLQLHLSDMHMVSFHQHVDVRRVLNHPGVERSMLTAYFKKNNTSEYARGILYRDFPKYYKWDS
jgi:hypothetical protein